MKQRIKIIKLAESETPTHPNNKPEGYERTGVIMDEPMIGHGFYMVPDDAPWRWFRTSTVLKIIDENTFETMNSIYKIERLGIIDETPKNIKENLEN